MSAAFPPERELRADSLFADFAKPASPGAAVVVGLGESVVFTRGYGLADVEDGVGVTAATAFRLASVTKQFTAAAILTLVEDGRLHLDDRLGYMLADVPAYARDVRVRHLLSHTSGIPDYEPILGRNGGPQLTFASYLRRRIFDRASMPTAVAHEDGVDIVANRAYGYSLSAGVWHRTDQSRTSAVLGDGGIYASAEELVRWSAALDRDVVVSAATLAMATSPVTLSSGEPTSYGFGWFLDEFLGCRRQRHEGDSVGFRTAIQRYPAERLTVVVLVNRSVAPVDALSDDVARIYLNR